MGFITPNPATGQLTGTVGDLVFARQASGKIIVRKRPVRTAPKREGEIVNQQEFKQAVAYAKAVWADNPELKAKYIAAARLQGRQGFHLAKADFLKKPEVREVDLSEYTGNPDETIRIDVEDDFGIKSVRVAIRQLDGAAIEEGAGVMQGGKWVYTARTQVPAGQTVVVEVRAMDYPEHSATKQVDHACGPRS